MGRGRRGGKRGGRGGRGGGRGGGGGGGGRRRQRQGWNDIPKENILFQQYYDELGIVPGEEREPFWDSLRQPLPHNFRFTGSKSHALPVLERLQSYYIPHIRGITFEGQPVTPPTPLPWYPNNLGWQITTPKTTIRRCEPFKEFQKFLVSESGVGNISRQEAVSMIPPIVLDVKPGMTVLDLCAAPGSKTAQLIEMVHGGEEARTRKVVRDIKEREGRKLSPDGQDTKQEIVDEEQEGDWVDDGRSTGLVIANDVDYKRAHMLIHQVKRLNSPNLIVTNHDASAFPSIKIAAERNAEGREVGKYLKFDRVLADVPCSGDGTARKNVNVWKEWSPLNGIGLHPLQSRILTRALQTLKVGGKVVYSTCSMNPIENEAVVAHAIDRCGGLEKVEIIDSSALLPGLKRLPGLHSWKVMDKQGRLWDTWESVLQQHEEYGVDGLGKLQHTMFPGFSQEPLPLERCMRVYPHLQDTGGFFIAALQKKSEIRARPEGQAKLGQAVATAKDVQVEKELRSEEDTNGDSVPPIMAVINGIELTEPTDSNPLPSNPAIEAIMQPPPPEETVDTASAADRQNQENEPTKPVSDRKRAAAEVAEAYAATKKPKVDRDDGAVAPGNEPAPLGEEERRVHYPPPPAITELTENTGPQEQHAKKKTRFFEEPFKYLSPTIPELQDIFKFYELDLRFPRDRFMVRNAEGTPSKTIYYTSELARTILQENEGKGFKFVHSGIKVFVKQDVPREDVCRWRIQAEGMPLLDNWIGEDRVIRLYSRKTLHRLLIEMFPRVAGEDWRELGEIGERIRDSPLGCFVLRVETGEGEDAFSERMVLPLWRSIHSINLMLPKEERKAMLLRLYNDNSPIQDNSKGGRQNKNAKVAAEEVKRTLDDDAASLSLESLDDDMDEDMDRDGPDDLSYVAPKVREEVGTDTPVVRVKEKVGDDDMSIDGDEPLEAGDVERHVETAQGAESSAIDERYEAEAELKPAY